MLRHSSELTTFASQKKFSGKGPICVALVVTQHAKSRGLPLDSESLLTDGGGQVLGLGRSAVQAILVRHGISRVLAEEGGRTSRGSLGKMRDYVAFLNQLERLGHVDLDSIESYWIERVREFFAAKPFKIKLDAARSLRTVVRDVIEQALDRQRAFPGMNFGGAVLQHLVGAKLDCALGQGQLVHNGFSTADAPTARVGDFLVGDAAIHVTTAPAEAVINRCKENLNDGYRPIIVTLQRGLAVAEALASNIGIGDRVDVFEIEQFVALNLYEIGRFAEAGRKVAVAELVERYNEIVEEFETDPSLRIALH